jgi:hypothetical protein
MFRFATLGLESQTMSARNILDRSILGLVTEVVQIEILNTNVRRCQSAEHPYCAKTKVRDQRVGSLDSCLLLGQMMIHENDDPNSANFHLRIGIHSRQEESRYNIYK